MWFHVQGNPLQLVIASLVAMFYLGAIGLMQPYTRNFLNVLALLSAVSMLFLYQAFLTYLLFHKNTVMAWHAAETLQGIIFTTSVWFIAAFAAIFLLLFGRHAP